jgi:hypothetical protein
LERIDRVAVVRSPTDALIAADTTTGRDRITDGANRDVLAEASA